MSAEGNGAQNGNGTNGSNPVDNPAMMAGKHGGQLRRGGVNPGAGRPPSAIRAAMREALDQRIPILEAIADDPKASVGDRMKAVDLLGKYGLGTTVTETDTEGHDAIRVIREPMRLRSVD